MIKIYLHQVNKTNDSLNSELLKSIYYQWAHDQRIQLDNDQLVVISKLQATLDKLILQLKYNKKSIFFKIKSRRPENPNLYIYGDVGRGKSMLMNLFFEACPIQQKTRFHYSKFMSEIHSYIHNCSKQNKTEIMAAYAQKLHTETQLLCIDEFYVTDIADAMMLERLFKKLFELNVTLVITSNRHPNDLYRGGIQKAQFLKFTELLQKKVEIISLDSLKDYRLSYLKSSQPVYNFPLGKSSDQFIKDAYAQLTKNAPIKAFKIKLLGRILTLNSAYQDIALTSFYELCEHPLGSNDYNNIAQQFNFIIIANIPKMSYEYRNEAKRFMTLIDALYEHHVKLICSAEVPAEELYTEGDGSFEFKRTISRLIEMQTQHYLN